MKPYSNPFKWKGIWLLLLCFSICIGLHAQTKDEHSAKATALYEKKNYPEALKAINLALNGDPNNTDNLYLKGLILEGNKQFQEAFETYTRVIELDPKDVIAYNQRGNLLVSLNLIEYALGDFDKALRIKQPDSIRCSLYLNRGVAKFRTRNFQGAYDDYLAAYKIDSLSVGVLNNLATVCEEIGKQEEGLKFLERILNIDPNFIGAYVNLGFAYQRMGDYHLSNKYLNKALEIDPEDGVTYNNRSYNKLKLGDLAGALKDVNKAIELYPGNSYAFRNRALIYLAMKIPAKACADIDRALELNFTQMYGTEMELLKSKHCSSM